MPLYLDIHHLQGISREALAEAHEADARVQKDYGVHYLQYWHNEAQGKVFCLVEAPTAEAAAAVHRDAHGLLPDKIIEVDPDVADGFLGGMAVNAAGAVLGAPGTGVDRDPATRTIVFTDIVDSTSTTLQLGDQAAMAWLGVHDAIVRGALRELGGREVKHTGDGIMASFVDAAAAVRCAARIQRRLRSHNAGTTSTPMRVRIGGTVGEPVERGGDLFGTAVQLAARLCGRADPEQVLVSRTLAELCRSTELRFADLGAVAVKGFDAPIAVCAVDWAHAD
jgi:class 3 adenylate cyclase